MTPHTVEPALRARVPDDRLDEVWCATLWADPQMLALQDEPADLVCDGDIGEFDLPPDTWV
ncbi:hypothetical protein [Niveibacterium sp.]|uniref:hypothetical protein n=1 Tax=Niveibacterium sp. TaxID=2017444 RepID=UPI0035B169BE